MGRRKKKLKQDIALKKAVADVIQQPTPSAAESPRTAPSIPPRAGSQGTGISPATCIAGMFLTLVLGLYLGTLLPGVINDIQEETPPQTATLASPPPPETAKLDPELAKLVTELEKKATANPNSAPDWINLGNIYFDALLPQKAIPAYEHALLLAPRNADVLTDLGIMYREAGQYHKALECFQNAVGINPRHENAMYNEGVVLSVDLKRKDEAIAAWERLLNINPQAHAPNGKPLAEMIRQLQ